MKLLTMITHWKESGIRGSFNRELYDKIVEIKLNNENFIAMKFEEINKKVESIKELNVMISEVEKGIKALSDNDCTVNFRMEITPDKVDKKPENIFNSDGDLNPEITGYYTPPTYPEGIYYGAKPIRIHDAGSYTKNNHVVKLDHVFINEPVSMMVLSYMHKEYVAYRTKLIKELEQTGIKL
jgi:hypothetical protein